MAEEEVIFVRRASGLVREVGAFTALSFVLGHVIGGGINFHSTMDAIKYPGASMPMAFVIAGIPSVLLGVSFALMAVMMPRAGGDYIFITRAMDPIVGFMSSWAFWFTEAISFGIIGAFDSWFFGLSLWIYGMMTHNQGLMNTGTWMQSAMGQIIVGCILVIIFSVLALVGMRLFGAIMNVIVGIPLITGIITIGYFAMGTVTPGLAQAQFNAIFGSGAWDKVFKAATDAGFSLQQYAMGSNFASTMGAATPATWAYIGFTMSSFIGSEVKDPSRSLMISMALGTVVIMAYYVILSGTCWGAFGDFITAYTYAADKAPQALAAALGVANAPPGILPFFGAVLAYPNTAIMEIIAITGAIWLMNDIPSFLLVTSRQIFAWSFDRFFPEFLAAVNDRFHTPHWSIIVTMIVGFIGVFANAYSWFIALVGTTVLCIYRYLFDAMCAAIIPYSRPEIYDKGLKVMVAGVPLITILGIIAFAWWTYIFYFACLALDPLTIATYMVWMGFGLFIFVAYWAYNKSKGIDPTTIYKEIPPA